MPDGPLWCLAGDKAAAVRGLAPLRMCQRRLMDRLSSSGTETIAHASAASAASATSETITSAISESHGSDRRATVATMTSGVHA